MKYLATITTILLLFLCLTLDFYDDRNVSQIIDSSLILDSQKDSFQNPSMDIDFTSIDHLIEGKEIIVLGENTHFGGTTYEFKTKLAKYLCDNKGYNAIFFEAGLYDTYKINNNVNRKNEAFWHFWCNTKDMHDFWDYIESKDSINLVGFDIQLSGRVNNKIRAQGIDSILAANNIDMPSALDSVKLNLSFLEYYKKDYSRTMRDSIIENLRGIANNLEEKNQHIESKYFSGMASWFATVWKYKHGDFRRFTIRDSLMADNIIFLKDKYFADKKIIIWASNMHTMNYTNKEGFISMGSILKDKYKDKMLTVCTSFYCKENEKHPMFSISSNRTLEHQLHVEGYKYALIHLSKMGDKSFYSRLNQGMEINETWGKATDIMFFMNKERNITYE